ncbi:uncharacterized protein LOC118200553 [Stegodyphus dumicola]|uniref:uncharacterized protein LOC118200553 n=1 Tax=Stegodyphus dumicola TaxID=202533 RepID=UPI0015A81D4E|nr:uncharacterized protein LOC118200553 [Stegodyphus dumicola]
MGSWILLLGFMAIATSDPINFEPFFAEETSFFSPPEEGHFGTFAGIPFSPPIRSHYTPNFRAPNPAESSDLPLYTDGVATPPQVTLSRLEKDYKAQLYKLASLQSHLPRPNFGSHQGTGGHNFRGPVFHSEPFVAASNVEERRPSDNIPSDNRPSDNRPSDNRPSDNRPFDSRPTSNSSLTTDRPRTSETHRTQNVELHTGFVPIIKGARQEKRLSQNIASTVIKDIEPPILTASSISSRPTSFKVSASVLSSSKALPDSRQRNNIPAERPVKITQNSFSRFLNRNNDTKFTTTISESVVSRVVAQPSSLRDVQQKELLRLSSSTSEDTRLAAKKILEINCDGSRDLGWCELGEKYPRKYVDQVVSSCQDVIQRMHVEVPHSFEKLSDTSDFKAELDNSTQRSARERGSHDAWSWAAYLHQGSLCEAETGFLRPETAKDTTGKWNIIVQTEALKQRVPIEMCRKVNTSCKKMLNCGLKSQCLQKYNYHLLLSLNPTQKHDCPFMKLYRFPSACVCHVE